MLDELPLKVVSDNRLRSKLPHIREIKRSESLILLVFEDGKRILLPQEQTLSTLLKIFNQK